MNHFDEMTGLLYLEGQLDADQARQVSTHVARAPSAASCSTPWRRKASGCGKLCVRKRNRFPSRRRGAGEPHGSLGLDRGARARHERRVHAVERLG